MAIRSVAGRLLSARHLPEPLWRAACSASFASTASWRDVEQQTDEIETRRQPQPGNHNSSGGRGGRPPGAAPTTALAVSAPANSLIWSTIERALETVHRLLMLVATIRRASANEAYVASFLQRHAGFDSFTLEYLQVARPALFRLSVGRDIEPVICWLRSIGISGPQLVELVRHTPSVLSCSVDDQLEPLAAWIASMGGDPSAVLNAYPGLVAVPVASLKGTRHVLRQLGAPDSDIAMLLLRLPDVYEQLALVLQRLFSDFAVAGWKLHARQRSQMQGMVHHHMTHWNRGSRRQPPYPDSEEAAMAGGGNSGGGASQQAQRPHGHVGHGHAAPPQRNRLQPQQGREGPPGGGPLLGTSYLLDREVYRGLVRVVSALEVIPLQAEGEERDAAISFLLHAIDQLAELGSRGAMARRQQAARESAA